MVVAEQNSHIVGFGILKLTGKLIPKLSDLYVKVDDRSNGIGSELIRYRETIAKSLGYSEMFVSVDPVGNPKMIELINKHGYKVMSAPYFKKAVYYNNDGTTYNNTYKRVDLKKPL